MQLPLTLFIIMSMGMPTNGKLSHNQTFELTRILVGKCLNNETILKSFMGKRFQMCPYKLDKYLECLNITKNNTIYYHPCPHLFYKDPNPIPVKCINGTWGPIDYDSYCELQEKQELELRKYRLLYEHGVITKWAMDREIALVYHKGNIGRTALITRWVDVCVCFFSFFVLLVLIPLKNHRVMLHRNLIVSVFLLDILDLIHRLWLVDDPDQKETCSFVYVAKLYFFMAQVSWMFNEGFFQFRQFYFVFVRKPYMWAYFVTGWVFPAVLVFGIYLPLMIANPPFTDHSLCWSMNSNYKWNYIVYVPAFLLLALNMGVVTYIMWIIWTKLRQGSVNELHKARKAARGFLILIFLLGGGYVFTIYGPKDCVPFQYMQAFIIPSQGTLICIVQVIISREVWDSAMTKFKRFSQNYQLSRPQSSRANNLSNDTASMSFVKRLSISVSRLQRSSFDMRRKSSTDVPENNNNLSAHVIPEYLKVNARSDDAASADDGGNSELTDQPTVEDSGVDNAGFEMKNDPEEAKEEDEYDNLLDEEVNHEELAFEEDDSSECSPETHQKTHNDIEDVMQGFEKQGVSLEPFHVDSGTPELYKSNAIDISASLKPKYDMSSDMYSGIMT